MTFRKSLTLVIACASWIGVAKAQHSTPDYEAALAAVESYMSSETEASQARAYFGLRKGQNEIAIRKEIAALPYAQFVDEIKASSSCALRSMEVRTMADSLEAFSYVQRIQPGSELEQLVTRSSKSDMVLYFCRPVGNMLMGALYASDSEQTTYEEYAASRPGLHFLFCADGSGSVVETFAKRNGNVQ